MSTLMRSGLGLAFGGVALALVLTAGGIVYQAIEAGGPAGATRTPKVRTYSVEVGTLTAETVTPVITSYGHVVSARSLEIRSAVAGPLVELSADFRDGGAVGQGDLLFRIDPRKLESALSFAKADVAEAEADLAEAKSGLELARLEADAAQKQLDLRDQALARQTDLQQRGVSTATEVEAASLSQAAAEQTLVNRRQVVAAAEARVAQAEITVSRRKTGLVDAARALDDATVTAPFAGVISAPTAIEGRLVSANEILGTLIDPSAMEVAFRLTNTQFTRLLSNSGQLPQTSITVLSQSGRNVTEIDAVLDRAGAEVGDGQIGRLVYARLTSPDPAKIRPGDFVSVRIPERPLADVVSIPSAAATADGRILLIGDDNRLEEFQATPVRNQGDTLVVTGVPFGRQYVLARALQLGDGIQVTPVEVAAASETPADAPAATEAAAPAAPATIALDEDRRAAIIAFINASENMKPEMRDKFLAELAEPEVPLATVEKFESKIAGAQ